MREITFSEADVQAIAHERYHHPDPRVQRHLEILWLKHHGFTHERLATLAGCSRSTAQLTLAEVAEGGLDPIHQVAVQPSHSAPDNHRGSAEQLLQHQPPRRHTG